MFGDGAFRQVMEVKGGHGGVGRLTQVTNRMGWSPCRKRRGGHRHTEGGSRGEGGERAQEDPALRASTTAGQPRETDTGVSVEGWPRCPLPLGPDLEAPCLSSWSTGPLRSIRAQ